ncbi:MAG: acyl-CoA dehydrogenase family protein [Deltaproteobacteria bacterium]|nr:acyl-CoA dehydrogenase family protein [Deltaproteobacteria bacterium]
MNFDLTDDQRLLVDTVTSFVKKESPVERFRKLRDDEEGVGWSRDVMRKFGELGWLAVPFSEDDGGLGGSMVDVALILEQLGAALAPEPFLASIVLGGLAIAHAGDAAQRARWLPDVIAGDKTLAFAHLEEGSRYDAHHVSTRAERTGTGFRLTGRKRWVLNGHAADAIVVVARTSGDVGAREGISLFVVDRGAPGVQITTVRTMDGHRAAMIALDGVEVGAESLLGTEGAALPIVERVLDGATAAACAEGLGLMTQSLQRTRDYLVDREQFGVKIGTFQALQHRAVDMFVETELTRGTTILAALRADDPDPLQRMRGVSVAKVQLARGGRYVVQQAIQLHGGIGITDEADVGLYFKRMHVLESLFGDEDWHLSRVSSPG